MDTGKVKPSVGNVGNAGTPGRAAAEAALSGRLASISLFDVCQFLMLNRKTGTLTVRSGAGTAYFTFQDGQLLTALNDALRDGEDVIMQAVQWTDGTFEFSVGPVPPDRRINVSTENILLEVARRIDEMQAARGEDGGGSPISSKESAFRERQHRAGALSEAFRTAVTQGDGVLPPSGWKDSIIAGFVEGTTDRVLLGPRGKICVLGPSKLQVREGIPEVEMQGWIDEIIPASHQHPRGTAGRRVGRGMTARSWQGPSGVRLWGERFRDQDGEWAILCHPREQLPTWEQLGLPTSADVAFEPSILGGLLLLGPTDLSLAVTAALLGRVARAAPVVGWVIERYPEYDWSVLPGSLRSIHPSFLQGTGTLEEILAASRGGILVLVGLRQGRLLSEVLRAAAGGLPTIVLDEARTREDWLRRLDPRDLRPDETPDGLAGCLRKVWKVGREQRGGPIRLDRALPGGGAGPARGPGIPPATPSVR